jgi:carbon storage regulator
MSAERGRLVVTRKIGEPVIIGSSITVTVVRGGLNSVQIAVEAPKDITVHRSEVEDRIDAGRRR